MRDCSASASGSALRMRNFSSSLFCGCEHHHRGEREASWLHHPPFKPWDHVELIGAAEFVAFDFVERIVLRVVTRVRQSTGL
jgi:hypothetical protein